MVAKVTLASAYLWKVGVVSEAVDEVHGFLADVFGPHLHLQGAQIDLCVDVVGLTLPTEWEKVFISHALTKKPIGESQKDRAFYQGRKLETINFSGYGNPVSCKLYNKVVEIRQHTPDKKWFHDLWKKHGWDEKQPVWRVEFSIEREGLNQMSLDDVYDVLRNLKRRWAYCTREWLRMVVPGRTRNRTRWATHKTWTLIQGAFDDQGCKMVEALGPLVRERKRQKNIEQGVAAIAGYATTLAAWCENELEKDADAEQIFSLIYEKVIERWERLRVTPQDMVREKKFLYHLVG